jgi:multicomponent Na+:H+ antiporter subunit D
MPYLFILSPLVLAVTLNLPLGRWIRKTGEWMTLLYCLIQSGAAFLPQDAFFFIRTNNVFDFFIRPGLAVDNISRLVLFSIGIVGFVAFLIARSMLIDKEERFNFANLVLVSLAGLNGVATVTDIFSLYVFLEIGSAASFIMIAFNGKREALEGAFKYIIMSAVATIFMLVSIALLIIYCGETSFLAIESCLKSTDNLP